MTRMPLCIFILKSNIILQIHVSIQTLQLEFAFFIQNVTIFLFILTYTTVLLPSNPPVTATVTPSVSSPNPLFLSTFLFFLPPSVPFTHPVITTTFTSLAIYLHPQFRQLQNPLPAVTHTFHRNHPKPPVSFYSQPLPSLHLTETTPVSPPCVLSYRQQP